MAIRRLPTITRRGDSVRYLKTWERILSPTLKQPVAPKIPWNFRATRKRGGILLAWETVKGADGYELSWSSSGDFSSAEQIIPLKSGLQDAHFDAVGGAPTTRYYKVRATAGTPAQPQSVKGLWSGTVSTTSTDATDTTTPETTFRDQAVTDKSGRLAVDGSVSSEPRPHTLSSRSKTGGFSQRTLFRLFSPHVNLSEFSRKSLKSHSKLRQTAISRAALRNFLFTIWALSRFT